MLGEWGRDGEVSRWGKEVGRSQGTVGALVPWNRRSACVAGSLLSSPVAIRSGGIKKEGAARGEVAYLAAVKRVDGVRDSRKECQCPLFAP